MLVGGNVGLGSPVIWARISEICVILSVCFEADVEGKESYRHRVRRGSTGDRLTISNHERGSRAIKGRESSSEHLNELLSSKKNKQIL